MSDGPKIDSEVRAQWRASAEEDLAAGRLWSTNPAAIISMLDMVDTLLEVAAGTPITLSNVE